MKERIPWIAVDLDGTLAEYHGWGDGKIGKPVPEMMKRVREWLANGNKVKIFTARVGPNQSATQLNNAFSEIKNWLEVNNLPRDLEITATKDYDMVELWDDRCVQVVQNTGIPIKEYITARYIKTFLPESKS
jgi:hypothetical protein